MGFADKMTPSAAKSIFRGEHESRFKTFPSRQKKGVGIPKNSVFASLKTKH